ncbi:uncharacterized protein METZ01_LOCUS280373, partial [marine metagenome]
MPINDAVREMLFPNRETWDSRYCRSKISRAFLSGSDIISFDKSARRVLGVDKISSGGNIFAVIG